MTPARTIAARLRAHDPEALRAVLAAITEGRGILTAIGARLGLTGRPQAITSQASRPSQSRRSWSEVHDIIRPKRAA